MNVLILGCGYTGKRVAARFVARGAAVTGTNRDWELAEIGRHVTSGCFVLHSVPPEGSQGLVDILGDTPARVVYLSTTAVYGSAYLVDENTPIAPDTERAQLRIFEEQKVTAGPWSSLILRPAGIYGPGRGIQERVKNGSYEMSDRIVSRIHVDDLAAHVEAGLLSTVTGAYPVADEEPCASREIAEFCGACFSLPATQPTTRAGRRVDGSAIRRLLGIKLIYPSYRVGIQAAASSPAVK